MGNLFSKDDHSKATDMLLNTENQNIEESISVHKEDTMNVKKTNLSKVGEKLGVAANTAVAKTKEGVRFVKNNTPSSDKMGEAVGYTAKLMVDSGVEVGKAIKENAPKIVSGVQKEAKSFWNGIIKGYNATK